MIFERHHQHIHSLGADGRLHTFEASHELYVYTDEMLKSDNSNYGNAHGYPRKSLQNPRKNTKRK